MLIRWTSGARRHLVELLERAAARRPSDASTLRRRLRGATDLIRMQPDFGRMVPEFGLETIRERIVRPYRIVYRLEPTSVQVLGVFPAKRERLYTPERI